MTPTGRVKWERTNKKTEMNQKVSAAWSLRREGPRRAFDGEVGG